MSSKDNKGKKIEPKVNYPTEFQLAEWMEKHQDDPSLFTIPNICLDSLGFYLFLKFCCENGDRGSALFVEAVAKYKVSCIKTSIFHHRYFICVCALPLFLFINCPPPFVNFIIFLIKR